MWVLLPIVTFGSTYVAGWFVSGRQAMFTMMVFIVSTDTAHRLAGRPIVIEDVVLGAAVIDGIVADLATRCDCGGMASHQRGLGGRPALPECRGGLITSGASEQSDDAVIALSQDTLKRCEPMATPGAITYLEAAGAIDPGTLDADNRISRLRTTADLIADLTPPPLGVYPQARKILSSTP